MKVLIVFAHQETRSFNTALLALMVNIAASLI